MASSNFLVTLKWPSIKKYWYQTVEKYRERSKQSLDIIFLFLLLKYTYEKGFLN